MLPAFCLFEWIILPLICGGLEVGAFTGCFCSGNKKTSSSEALNKNPDWRGFCREEGSVSAVLNVGSLLAFGALRDFERNFLTFFKCLESGHVDCGEMCE